MSGNAFFPSPCSLVRIRTRAVLLVSMLAALGSSGHAQSGVSDELANITDIYLYVYYTDFTDTRACRC